MLRILGEESLYRECQREAEGCCSSAHVDRPVVSSCIIQQGVHSAANWTSSFLNVLSHGEGLQYVLQSHCNTWTLGGILWLCIGLLNKVRSESRCKFSIFLLNKRNQPHSQ